MQSSNCQSLFWPYLTACQRSVYSLSGMERARTERRAGESVPVKGPANSSSPDSEPSAVPFPKAERRAHGDSHQRRWRRGRTLARLLESQWLYTSSTASLGISALSCNTKNPVLTLQPRSAPTRCLCSHPHPQESHTVWQQYLWLRAFWSP
jgi:hypothetical protein